MFGAKDYAVNFSHTIFRRWYLGLLAVGGLLVIWTLSGSYIPNNLLGVWVAYLFLYVFLLLNEVTTRQHINAAYLLSAPLVAAYLTFGLGSTLALWLVGQAVAELYTWFFMLYQDQALYIQRQQVIRQKAFYDMPGLLGGLAVGVGFYLALDQGSEALNTAPALLALVFVMVSVRALVVNRVYCFLHPGCTLASSAFQIGWRAALDGSLTLLALLLPLAVRTDNSVMFGGLLVIFIIAALGLRSIRVVYLALTSKVQELEILDRLSKSLIDVTSREEVYQLTYELVAQLMSAQNFFIAEPNLPMDQGSAGMELAAPSTVRFPFVIQNGHRASWGVCRWVSDSLPVRTIQAGSLLIEDCSKLSLEQSAQLPVTCASYLGVPILYQDEPSGMMGVLHSTGRGIYTDNDRRLLETIAAQVAIVSRVNYLRQQTQHFTEGLVAINHVSNVVNASLEQTTIFEEVCRSACELTGADSAIIFLKAEANQRFEPVYNSGLSEDCSQKLADSIGAHHGSWMAWLSRLGVKVVADFSKDEQATWLAPIMAESGIAALILTPFIAMHSLLEADNLSPERDLLGFQIVFFSQPYTPQDNTLNLLQMLANQSAIALENVGLFAETQHTLRRLVYLEESTRVFTENLELSSVAQSIVEWIVMALELDSATLTLWNDTAAGLTINAHAHKPIGEFSFVQEKPAFDQPLDQLPELALTLENQWSRLYRLDETDLSPALRAVMTRMQFSTLMLTPLVLRNDVMGLLALGRHDDRQITANDINVAEAIASQAAAAIQNAQFYAFMETELTARVTEISVLENVLRSISASADEQAIVRDVLKAAAIVTEADMMSCALVRPQDLLQIYWYSEDASEQLIAREYPDVNRGVIGRVLRTGQSQIIPDTQKVIHYWTPEGFEGYRSELCVPIMHQGKALGVLNVESYRTDCFDLAHQRFMQSLAGHAAIALMRAELLSKNHRQIAILDTIRSLSLELLDTIDLTEALHKVCLVVMNITHGLNVQVYFYDAETDSVIFAAGLSDDGRRDVEISPPRPDGLTFRAIRTEKPVLSDNFSPIPGIPTRRLGVFPLKHQGRVIGTLNVGVSDPDLLDRDEIRALELLANQTASAVARSQLFIERQRQIELSDKLRQLSVAMLNALTMPELLQIICDGALDLVAANEVHLYFYAQTSKKLTFAANLWRDGTRNQEVPLNPHGIIVQTVEAGQVVVRENKYPSSRPGFDVQTVAGIPLKYGTELIGAIGMSASRADYFGEAELQTLELFANQSAPAIINMWYYEEIRDGRDQMQVVLNTVRDALVLVNRRGRVLQVNPAAERLLGMDLMAHHGEHLLRILHRFAAEHNLTEDDFRHPDHTKALWRELEEDIYQITRRDVSRDTPEGTIYLEEESAPVLAENGDTIGRLFVWHDVTEARQMAEARDELTNTIIHDLRSPLASIKSGLHMMPEILTESDSLEQSLKILATAEHSADGLLDLVSGLLDVARLESGSVPLNRYPTDFAFPLTEALQTLSVLAQEQDVNLYVDMPESLPPVNIDAEKIRRVLINLIDNALHYTPAEGRVVVMVDEEPDGDFLLITVDDSGQGIPPDKREEIFNRFITGVTGGKTEHKGLGLGLAFCKLAVEAHGGAIWVEDGLNGGAAFRFTLPIVS